MLHFAAERGRGEAARERIFRAYMSEGQAIGDREVLATLANEAELDAGEVRALLATDAYASEVRADESEAAAKGIQGVPHFRIGPQILSGAQPAELLLAAMRQAIERLDVKAVDRQRRAGLRFFFFFRTPAPSAAFRLLSSIGPAADRQHASACRCLRAAR